jgi:hypothetical protein
MGNKRGRGGNGGDGGNQQKNRGGRGSGGGQNHGGTHWHDNNNRGDGQQQNRGGYQGKFFDPDYHNKRKFNDNEQNGHKRQNTGDNNRNDKNRDGDQTTRNVWVESMSKPKFLAEELYKNISATRSLIDHVAVEEALNVLSTDQVTGERSAPPSTRPQEAAADEFEDPRETQGPKDQILNCFANNIIASINPDRIQDMMLNNVAFCESYIIQLFGCPTGAHPPVLTLQSPVFQGSGAIQRSRSEAWKSGLAPSVITYIKDVFYGQQVFHLKTAQDLLMFTGVLPAEDRLRVRKVRLGADIFELPRFALADGTSGLAPHDVAVVEQLGELANLSIIQFDFAWHFENHRYVLAVNICDMYDTLETATITLPSQKLGAATHSFAAIAGREEIRREAVRRMSSNIEIKKERKMLEQRGRQGAMIDLYMR